MVISVIIPTKNRLGLLQQCVASLQQHLKAAHEIVVVDNGNDGSADWARAQGLKAVVQSPLTFAQACNLGAQTAWGDWLLLCNNDIIVQSRIKVPTAEGIYGYRLLYPNGLIQHAGVGFDLKGNPYHLWHLAPAATPEAMSGCVVAAVTFAFAFISRRLWDRLGGLDTAYINSYEDTDFCLRAREIGCQIFYRHDAEVTHLTGQTEGRHDNVAASWAVFRQRWVDTGRIYRALGMWPFEMT